MISPANGSIIDSFSLSPDEGEVITIRPYPPLQGVKDFVKSQGYDESAIVDMTFYIAHITPLKTSGEVEVGEPIGTAFDGWWGTNKIGYVITVSFRGRDTLQFSPCELPNTAEFCGKCYPGTPLPCP